MHTPIVLNNKPFKFLIFTLVVVGSRVVALPATLPSPDLSPGALYQPINSSLSAVVSPKPVCDKILGELSYDDCNEAIKLLPHDRRGQPVMRNFYTDPSDASTTLPNQQVPFEKTYGGSTQEGEDGEDLPC